METCINKRTFITYTFLLLRRNVLYAFIMTPVSCDFNKNKQKIKKKKYFNDLIPFQLILSPNKRTLMHTFFLASVYLTCKSQLTLMCYSGVNCISKYMYRRRRGVRLNLLKKTMFRAFQVCAVLVCMTGNPTFLNM